MPLRPLQECTSPGCRVLVRGSRCDKHPRTPWQSRQGSGRGGSKWRNRRERIFTRDKYLCQRHLRLGQLVGVDLHGSNHGVCDHIVPLSQGGTDDDSNLETICQTCDKEKSMAEAAAGSRAR